MPDNAVPILIISFFLVIGSAFFVAAEYSIVSSRKSRIESFARKGNRRATILARELENTSRYVAGSQIGITMLGIGVGAITEPFVVTLVTHLLGQKIDHKISLTIAFLLVSFVLVVIGELVPKYATLRNPERTALLLFTPLRLISLAFTPLIWVAQKCAQGILRIFGASAVEHGQEAMPKEELLLLIQAGGSEGVLDKKHAELVTRALRLDVLSARDIMIHRLDVKWLDASWSKEETLQRLKELPYSRLPLCNGDIDDLIGVIYVHDIIRNFDNPKFDLREIAAPSIAIPENLPMERIVSTMHDSKSKILIVMDEYGGTSGLVTLEDVVEEVFGELEDRIESERPTIEISANGRVSARAEVRMDELITFLELPLDVADHTDTLATIMVETLERVPKTGDHVETILGTMWVENMARRRITRVAIQLSKDLYPRPAN